jgi:16S rRNA (cytidine1402-2'-O)-methyltransferase
VKVQLGREDRGEMVLVLAGASAKRIVTEVEAGFDGVELPDWAKAFLAAAREGGMTQREAVKPLAKHLGVSASEIYRLASDV